jgi:NADH-quinone oxidoreductase subunit E
MNMPASENALLPGALREEIEELTTHYPERRAALIPALHLVQGTFGYVADQAMVEVGEILGIPPADVLGTLTFYTMFRREPSGAHHVNVCKNLSCDLTGSREIRSYLEEKLGITVGETTGDGLFTLGLVECLGACTEAPVMEIDGEYHFRLTPERVDAILAGYRDRARKGATEGEQ